MTSRSSHSGIFQRFIPPPLPYPNRPTLRLPQGHCKGLRWCLSNPRNYPPCWTPRPGIGKHYARTREGWRRKIISPMLRKAQPMSQPRGKSQRKLGVFLGVSRQTQNLKALPLKAYKMLFGGRCSHHFRVRRNPTKPGNLAKSTVPGLFYVRSRPGIPLDSQEVWGYIWGYLEIPPNRIPPKWP